MTAAPSRYPVRVERDVSIPMSDGVRLAADLYLPDAAGPFPVVFDYYPYRKDDVTAATARYHRYLAARGYAALRLDVRGTGGSDGRAANEYALQEQLDAVEAIDWMAAQPWSTGAVGMFGSSYGGFNSLQVAMQRPKPLRAICPMYFTDNRYTDDCHYKGGGLQMLFDTGTYGLAMVVMNSLPPHPERSGERWTALWDEHLTNEPWMLEWLEHQTWDAFWQHGSLCQDYASVECATYLFGGWRDGYTNCNLRTFRHLRCPRKLLIGPWLHTPPDVGLPGPRIDHLNEMTRFYDFWLKGIDNGVMAEPPVTLYVQQYDPPRADRETTRGFWRHEAGWPLERSRELPLYPGSGGTLCEEIPPEGTENYRYDPTSGTTFGLFSASSPYLLPDDQRREEAYSIQFTSAPLVEPLEILGYPELRVRLRSSAALAASVVRLIDVAPDGGAALVTKGVLNLTHRESHSEPSPLVPGEWYDVTIVLDATSWLFEPGHRVRVAYSGSDFPNLWPSPDCYDATLRLGGKTPACLVLPVLGPVEIPLPLPHLEPPAPFEPLVHVEAEPTVWRITREPLAGTAEVYMRSGLTARLTGGLEMVRGNDMRALVFEREPSHASVTGHSSVTLRWPDRTIESRARGRIESTGTAFQASIELSVTADGQPRFEKKWLRSVPRRLL